MRFNNLGIEFYSFLETLLLTKLYCASLLIIHRIGKAALKLINFLDSYYKEIIPAI